MIAVAVEKKNPYVMTIGFKKNNPEHIRVAEFLNSMGREKAQYIVKAILTYRTLEEQGDLPQTSGSVSCDYDTIKSIVLQIMREQGEEGKIHCGEGFEVLLNDVWVPTRMEMAGEWYFVGLPGLKLDGLTVRR